MCKYGDTVNVVVIVPADLSSTGKEAWRTKAIDRCIAPIVHALQNANIDMRSSCCGHGKGDGEIILQDGRTLVIKQESSRSLIKWIKDRM